MKANRTIDSKRQLIRTAHLMKRWQNGGHKPQTQARSRVAAFSKQACLDLTRRTEALLQARPGHSLWMSISSDSTPPPAAAIGRDYVTQPHKNHKETPVVQKCSSSSGQPAPLQSVQDLLSHYKLNRRIPELNDDQLKQFIKELLEHSDIFEPHHYKNTYQPSHVLGILLSRAYYSKNIDQREFDQILIDALTDQAPNLFPHQNRKSHVFRALRNHLARFHLAEFISRNFTQLFFTLQADFLLPLTHTNYRLLVSQKKLRGFLDTEHARTTLQYLGLSEKSSGILAEMTQKKEFVSDREHFRMIQHLLSSLNGYFSDDATAIFKLYVNTVIESLSPSRKDIKKLFNWLSSFIFAPQWIQIQIATNAIYDQSGTALTLDAELKRIDQFYEDNLVQILNHADVPRGSLVMSDTNNKALIGKIFNPNKQDQTAKDFVAQLKKNGFYPKILHAVRWLSTIGICELRNFIVRRYKEHISKEFKKSLSLQEFPSDFIDRWKQDFETDYNPRPQVDIDQFLKNARQRLHDLIFKHEVPMNIFSRWGFIEYAGLFGDIKDIYRKLESGTMDHREIWDLYERLKDLNQNLNLHMEYLHRQTKPFSVLRAAEYLNRMEIFLYLYLHNKFYPSQFDDSVYKARVTDDSITMITTGEEPYNNCLSLWSYSGTNYNGVSFRRTNFVNYKTFVIEETNQDGSKKIACFADMEIRQYKGGTVLLVDQFYLRSGWMDEEGLKQLIRNYAKDHLHIPDERVFFPADQNKLPGIRRLDLTLPLLDSLSLAELQVYRDNFRLS